MLGNTMFFYLNQKKASGIFFQFCLEVQHSDLKSPCRSCLHVNIQHFLKENKYWGKTRWLKTNCLKERVWGWENSNAAKECLMRKGENLEKLQYAIVSLPLLFQAFFPRVERWVVYFILWTFYFLTSLLTAVKSLWVFIFNFYGICSFIETVAKICPTVGSCLFLGRNLLELLARHISFMGLQTVWS